MLRRALAALALLPAVGLAAPITVLTYDSFAAPSGLGPVLAKEAKRHGLDVRYRTFDSASALALRVGGDGPCPGDVVVGIDEVQFGRVRSRRQFLPQPDRAADVPAARWFDPSHRFVPYDHGYLAIVYDSARGKPVDGAVPLASLATDPRYHKRIAFLDPRTAGVGLAFLLWTRAVLGDAGLDGFWRQALKQAATVAPSWTAAYALFAKGEVDYVLSYTTSPAYHLVEEKKGTVKALPIAEGHWPQTEAAAVLACASRPADAAKVVALLVGKEVQSAVPTKQWMYPVRADVPLPQAFQTLPVPKTVATGPLDALPKAIETSLRRWREVMAR